VSSDENKPAPAKGFAGLSSMVSDVDSAVEMGKQSNADQSTKSKESPAQAASAAHAATGSGQAGSNQPATKTSLGKWILGIGAVLSVFWLISINSGTKSTSAIPVATQVAPSVPANKDSTGRDWSQQAPVPLPAVPNEERPPVGTGNVLNVAQIRYCLAEDIRLSAGKAVVNQYLDTEVDRYNALVSDYNSRCGQFRYRRGGLESARADVEGRRAALEAEGAVRFRGSSSRNKVPHRQPVTPSPSFDNNVSDARAQTSAGTARPAFPAMDPTPVRPAPQAMTDGMALSNLSLAERESLASACSYDKNINGPAAYNACLRTKLAALASQGSRPDLSTLNGADRESIESACSYDKNMNGPAAYNACLRTKLAALASQGGRPNLSTLNGADRESIESACSYDKNMNGPAAYNSCLARQFSRLGK
jgi:hypothetical protein